MRLAVKRTVVTAIYSTPDCARAWLHCDGCRHSIMIEPRELAQRHRLDMLMSLLTISKRCAALRGAEGHFRHIGGRGDRGALRFFFWNA
jgi:hypothetical protein